MVGSHLNNGGEAHNLNAFCLGVVQGLDIQVRFRSIKKKQHSGVGFRLDEKHVEKPFTENVSTTPPILSSSAVDGALLISKPLSSHFLVTPKQQRRQGHIGCTYTPYQSTVLPLIPTLLPHLVASPHCVHPLTSVAEVLNLERRLTHVVDMGCPEEGRV